MTFALAALLALAPTTTAPAAPALRTAEAILADHVAAIGGAAALGRHKTLRLKRKVTVKGLGIEGTEERFATAGNRFLSVTTIPGLGTIKQGSDGKSFWSEDPINGPRLLTGAEKEQARLDAHWNSELHLTKLYKKVTPVPAPEGAPAGSSLECLALTPGQGQPMTVCFDAKTHERVFQTGRQSSPQGEIPFAARFSEWKSHDGVKLPMLEETSAGPTSIEARVTEVKFDEPLADVMFKMSKNAKGKAPKPAATAATGAGGAAGAAPGAGGQAAATK